MSNFLYGFLNLYSSFVGSTYFHYFFFALMAMAIIILTVRVVWSIVRFN